MATRETVQEMLEGLTARESGGRPGQGGHVMTRVDRDGEKKVTGHEAAEVMAARVRRAQGLSVDERAVGKGLAGLAGQRVSHKLWRAEGHRQDGVGLDEVLKDTQLRGR